MTWTDRFAAMSHEDRLQTIAEDGSTLQAFINEARLNQDWYRRWCLARAADPPAQPEHIACPGCGNLTTGRDHVCLGDAVEFWKSAEHNQAHAAVAAIRERDAARRALQALNAAAIDILAEYGPPSEYDPPYRAKWLALQYAIRAQEA